MSSPELVLVVDDEADFARGLSRLLATRLPGCEIVACTTPGEALDILGRREVAVLATDLRMPAMTGQELLERALALEPSLSVVVMTAHGSIETAVAAVRSGAYDFLTKPVDPQALARVVDKGLERTRLLRENSRLRSQVGQCPPLARLVGESPAMRRLKEAMAAVAASDYTLLIRGESGTGKELVARSVHELSPRGSGPFVSVNCPAIPASLLESELFGHVKGAFTGADRDRKGLFAHSRGGSLLLDEIGDISADIQTKLLRVLQDRVIRPVGSSQTLTVDARIMASTNADLEARITGHAFREDLFYRLNVLTLEVPALRQRREDIPLLARHFLSATCAELRLPPKDIDPAVLADLAGRGWPGNVRELENYVRRLVVFCPGPLIGTAQAALVDGRGPSPRGEAPEEPLSAYKDAKSRAVEEFTRRYVAELLRQTRGNISEAARVSGIERVSLQKILKRYAMEAREYRE